MNLVVAIHYPLDRITLDVDLTLEGGLTALLGPSGSGKTRTLDVVAGLLRPARGRVVLDGDVLIDTAQDIWTPPNRRRIGYMFQDSRLFPHLTVRHNLTFGRWFGPARHESTITVDDIVSLLDLGPLLARHPGRLSGGEKRRVALGRALLSHPRLLLLDEPLGSLDDAMRQEILPYLDRLIADLRMPMIYVTHDWSEVKDRAARVVLIDKGRTRLRGIEDLAI